MFTTRRLFQASCMALGLMFLMGGSCVIQFPDDPPGDGGGGGGGGDPTGVTIVLVNGTNTTLDPEFYRSAEAVSADQLFQPGRKYTAFGVGTIGLLGDFDRARFTLPCEEVRIIGTSGGRFGDNINEPDGRGQQFVLAQNTTFFCGDTITITYTRVGSEYRTSFAVERGR